MICAIVLAAGQSRRMGTQKLLLDYGGKSVISHIVGEVVNSDMDQVIVVVGCDRDRVSQEVSDADVSVVFNDNYRAGMLSSVRCGLETLSKDCEAVMVVLGDQPTVTSKLINEMIRAYRGSDRSIVVPTYQGRHGHPVIISSRYTSEVMSSFDEVGLRGLIAVHGDEVLELDISDTDVSSDMDEPADYERQIDNLNKNR